MYDYVAVRIDVVPCDENITDLLAAFLAEVDFETFEPDEKGLTAYVRKDKYDKNAVEEILSDFPIPSKLTMTETEIEGEDWNKEWEQNYFQPIHISDRLVIRSSFHESFPDIPIEIIIDPKMAFGTGHHATTAGMSKMLLEETLKGKRVIDMGTGTGILAILSKKLGSGDTVGIDIDEFALENAKENGALNGEEIDWKVGDDKVLHDLEPADIFLANINLNVITENLGKYVSKLKSGGKIFLSGFLVSDRARILEEAEKYGLILAKESAESNWETMVFQKL
ncbi:MAG: 50S ribosomal protein L11 methyltransferase [Muribaculaceae bacterium]|nr:50S ribosomal protein L11 methyltransferase [Muribaculaceae bacterium]